MSATPPLARRLLAEWMGSALLAALVTGSGIAAQHLSPGDVGLELFENAAATPAGLFVIIVMFGPVSGAHLNPVVSLVDASFSDLLWRDALAYIPAQITGCAAGAVLANGMFALSAVSISTHHRASPAGPCDDRRRPLDRRRGDDRRPRASTPTSSLVQAIWGW